MINNASLGHPEVRIMSARQVSHTSNTSKRPQGKTGPGPGQTTKRITWPKLLVAALVLALAGIPFILDRYMELKTPGPFDSGAYVYSAQRLLSGARLGAEERPSALTGTLLVNMLGVKLFGFSETGPKLMQALFQAAALIMMFFALRRIFGTLAATVAVTIAAAYLSAPLIAKYGNVKEQFMIAVMTIGICSLLLRQAGGRWWWTVLAGAFVSWGPLFKPTGLSAIGAIALFIIVQPLFKHRTLRQTGIDIVLLLAGAALALAPTFYWWHTAGSPKQYIPYRFAFNMLYSAKAAVAGQDTAGATSPYVTSSREAYGFSEQFDKVLRFYWLLITPIALAAAAIIARLIRILRRLFARVNKPAIKPYDRLLLLLALWWMLDMAFIWISPRSYEQYYLPMCASGAVTAAYLVGLYRDRFDAARRKLPWTILGSLCVTCLIVMTWHIFAGTSLSTHTGQKYAQPRHGYKQRLAGIAQRKNGKIGPWELVGRYIREKSDPTDKIYVWGWYPGIYVQAQRVSSASTAFESNMHTMSPARLSREVERRLDDFKKESPRFIVDSRKRHFPFDRPPLELWPQMPDRKFVATDPALRAQYDAAYKNFLTTKYGPDEAARYDAMRPFRDYLAAGYRIVRLFGIHVLFERKQ